MTDLFQASDLADLQQACIILWKEQGLKLNQSGFLALVQENHAFNYQLWQAEDRARRDDKGPEFVYQAKREIDQYNQQRNNRMEAMDQWIYEVLKPADQAIVHSETPGMIIDRLSILALKAYHMNLQTKRMEVDEAHRANCELKVQKILAQQAQLVTCLAQLMEEIRAGKRTFRVYHQFKMYNDPTLNPELYGNGISA